MNDALLLTISAFVIAGDRVRTALQNCLGAALMLVIGASLNVSFLDRPLALRTPTADITLAMSVRFIFRCQFCSEQPDPLTQLNLEKAMREITWGAYQNVLPGRWLMFHAHGLYGSPRYACDKHRGDLVAHLREHFGTIGFHVWKRPPYPNSLAHSDTDHAWIAATRRQGGWGS